MAESFQGRGVEEAFKDRELNPLAEVLEGVGEARAPAVVADIIGDHERARRAADS